MADLAGVQALTASIAFSDKAVNLGIVSSLTYEHTHDIIALNRTKYP